MKNTMISKIIPFVLLAAGIGFLTGCDAVLESFYPEFARDDDFDYSVTMEAIVEINANYSLLFNSSDPLRIAVVPFEETMHGGFIARWDNAEIQTFTSVPIEYGDEMKAEFSVPRGYRYAVIAWHDQNGSNKPDAGTEPAVMLKCESDYSLTASGIPTIGVDEYTVDTLEFSGTLVSINTLTVNVINELTGSALLKESKGN
jgi:hypothetical protein